MDTRHVAPASQVREWQHIPDEGHRRCQVLVVGGGLSGCAAAVAAARVDVDVVLVEPGHLLGGEMTASGMGAASVAPNWVQTSEQGFWGEVVAGLRAAYGALGLGIETCGYRLPAVAGSAVVVDGVLTDLLRRAGVMVLRNAEVRSLDVDATGARGELTCGPVRADVVVDASETGSVIAMAGLPHRLGNTIVGRDGARAPADVKVQDVVQPVVVRRQRGEVPPELRFGGPPPGWDRHREWVAQSYPYRPGRSSGGASDWTGEAALPDMAGTDAYTAFDLERITRTAIVHGCDVPATGAVLTDPATAARVRRQAIERSLAVLYHLQMVLHEPWAVAVDEGFAEGPAARTPRVDSDLPAWVRHLPPRLLLRESRRILGVHTMSSATADRATGAASAPWNPDTVAVATWAQEMHGAGDVADLESDLGETNPHPDWRSGPVPIPFGSLVTDSAVRLVAAGRNISMSRVVGGTVRAHPAACAVGQAAGVVAAGAARRGTAPRDLPVPTVQLALLRQGAILLPAPVTAAPPRSADHPAVSLALLARPEVALTMERTIVLEPDELAWTVEQGRELVARAGAL